MSTFADEPEVTPDNKKGMSKVTLFAIIGFACLLAYGIWQMTAGRADSKKQTQEASRNAVSEHGAAVDTQTESAMKSLIDNQGGVSTVGEKKREEMRRKMDEDIRAAKAAGQTKADASDSKQAKSTGRYPSSLDANGHPKTDDDGGNGDPSKPKVTIPGKPEGWNPEGEIIVPGGQSGAPAYRYVPAYLRGSNLPYDPQTIQKWDQDWIEAARKPFAGKSVASTNTYSKLAGEVQVVRRGQGNSGTLRLSGAGQPDPRINQPSMPTPIKRTYVTPVRVVPVGGVR